MRVQVGIVGAGPAGLTLALLLNRAGISSVVLEARDRDYVGRRVRAGLLEHNTVELMHGLGVGGRLDAEGLQHHGVYLRRPGHTQHVEITRLTGRHLTIYGQQEVVKDLIDAGLERGVPIQFEVADVKLWDLESERPRVTFTDASGVEAEVECDFVAGCDGFHGVCRTYLPSELLTEYDLVYPFDWLGILAEAEPATDELIYAWHPNGFSLHSMRSNRVSRLYIQVPQGTRIEEWSDEAIWDELQNRLASPGWRRLSQDAEPGERILLVVDGQGG